MVISRSGEVVPIQRSGPDLSSRPPWSYGSAMFTVHCPRHGARVLLGPRSIEALVNRPDGIELSWLCHCGTRGVLRNRTAAARPAA